MTAMLDVQDLVKRFPLAGTGKVVQAVNDVSFTIDRGETLALVGESGSGKDNGRALHSWPDRRHERTGVVRR